jgi:hypothetical protein
MFTYNWTETLQYSNFCSNKISIANCKLAFLKKLNSDIKICSDKNTCLMYI